jgi:hypothetical protein
MQLYSTSDRIQKAFQLFVEGRIISIGKGLWHCESNSGLPHYKVTEKTCTCPDFFNRHRICKHLLAGPGIRVVLAIREMRSASDVNNLRQLAEKYEDPILAAQYRFRKVAADEYKALRERLLRGAVSSNKLLLARLVEPGTLHRSTPTSHLRKGEEEHTGHRGKVRYSGIPCMVSQ